MPAGAGEIDVGKTVDGVSIVHDDAFESLFPRKKPSSQKTFHLDPRSAMSLLCFTQIPFFSTRFAGRGRLVFIVGQAFLEIGSTPICLWDPRRVVFGEWC
jgi:hypothetical protein